MVDYTPLIERETKVLDFVKDLTIDDLRAETNKSIDFLLEVISDLDDADIVFDPVDENANDPYATEGEENIGWTLGHLIAHVTASSEEGAAFSSLLARGIEAEERPRYETPARYDNKGALCTAFGRKPTDAAGVLDAWPDEPHLDVYRKISERFEEIFGKMNASAAFIFGLVHEVGHYDQIKEVKQQALQAKAANV